MRMSFLTGWTLLLIATRSHRTGKSIAIDETNRRVTFTLLGACTSSYYTPTKCVDRIDRYDCLCGQGQQWDGYSCVGMNVNVAISRVQK